MQYQDFSANDFLLDEYFLNWVLQPNDENNLFWQTWLSQNPQKQETVTEARQLLLNLNFKNAQIPAARIDKMWDHITANIGEAKIIKLVPEETEVLAPSGTSFKMWYRVAAVFIGVILAGLGLLKYQQTTSNTILIATQFGETKKVTLPDNSIAILNGSSSIKYTRNWDETTPREVELDGEAYFSVTHTKNHQKFQVKVSDELQVEVLGTKFTVTDRPTKTRVVLTEGKVKLAYTKNHILGIATGKVAETVMKPGEKIEVNSVAEQLSKEVVEAPEEYADFQQNKITFRDTPLSEVARLLEDTYGLTVVFAETSLAKKRFTGTSPHNRVDMLLQAIEKSFNIKVTRKGKNILIDQK